jgi:hypothetical protein
VWASLHTPNPPSTALSLGPEALSTVLEGRGRAKGVWRAFREGLDPFEADPESELHDARVSGKTRTLLRERTRPFPWRVTSETQSRCAARHHEAPTCITHTPSSRACLH